MKNIIIGTAGHVDHGKTALIKALTGIETDRIKEEKKRGITIELGFAYLDLPDGEKAGIIDVPGHEKFVKNMLAGAGGIDLALLVIAADEGFMPQTREHLGILSLLNIPEGIIVITKKDMVDEDWLEVVCEDIRNEVKGTFLENAQMIAVSSYTGEGIEELRQAIFQLIDQKTQIKNLDIPFRIPIDRIFSVEGFGTVITGTLIEGKMKVGDPVTIYPSRLESRIRNLQVHSHDVEEAYAGQRVAVNLAGLKKTDLNKGDVVAAPNSMHTTMMIDIKLTVLKDCEREILNATRLHLYHGARDVLCKIVLLDRDSISAGESCYAQLRLEEEIAVKTGDRFVLRFYSPLETIGGGVVLDSNPFKHKRNDPQVLESLNIKENGSDKEKISAALKDYSSRFETLDFLQVQTAIPKEQFDQQIQKLIKDKIAFRISDNVVIHVDYLNHLKDVAVKMLTAYHAENPLRDGMKRDEFRGKFIKYEDMAVVDKITDSLVNRKVLKIVNGCVALYDFEAQTDNNQELIEKAFYEGGFSPESPDQIAARFPKIKNFKAVLEALVNSGKLVRVEDKILLHVDYYNKALEMAKEHIAKNGQITLAEMRDLMGASRKFAVAVLEYWDRRNITKKVGDARVLK
ncbi:selenocysteine-specific translation elongation factor [uncultured Negativibacillus sp.]|uniref:selenocysteine-specific translation elongation factor n=1 Tax=uncultured Negativibacillus sp. TaxID=1980696 RepID=UPI0025EFF023|nr:selenocysteine-specific translation elongation factor [uncultured Negativibacillus sp.]